MYSMLIGHSMDIVSMPKVSGSRTTFAKIRSIQTVDTCRDFRIHNAILLEMGVTYAAEV